MPISVYSLCKGVWHWAISNYQQLLFDPIASELPLLDVNNAELLRAIYKDSNSDWIKIGITRDPVTRLLSSYLDINDAHSRPLYAPDSQDWGRWKGIRREELEWLNGIDTTNEDEDVGTMEAFNLTFTGLISALEKNMSYAPPAFRPISSLCGIQHTSFETIIPFETLQVIV